MQCIRQTKLFVLDWHPSEADKAWVINFIFTNEEQGTERRVGKWVGTLQNPKVGRDLQGHPGPSLSQWKLSGT